MNEEQDPEKSSVRISISEEKLRQMFAELKLELVEEFAKKASQRSVRALKRRVTDLELWRAGRDSANRERQHLSARQLAWAALLSGLIASVATLVWLHHG